MKAFFEVGQVRTPILLLGLLMLTLVGGCITVTCPNCGAGPCGSGGDGLPCQTISAPAGDASCANGGRKCAMPGGPCTKPTGGMGTCQNTTTNGTCGCLCS